MSRSPGTGKKTNCILSRRFAFEFVAIFIFNFIKCSSTMPKKQQQQQQRKSLSTESICHWFTFTHTHTKCINTFCECPTYIYVCFFSLLISLRISRTLISFLTSFSLVAFISGCFVMICLQCKSLYWALTELVRMHLRGLQLMYLCGFWCF